MDATDVDRYTFLKEPQSLKHKLCVTFVNYISAEEYEFARAVLLQIAEHVTEKYALALLENVLENTKKIKGLKTSPRLLWFFFILHQELESNDDTIEKDSRTESILHSEGLENVNGKYNSKTLEFELLLDTARVLHAKELKESHGAEEVTEDLRLLRDIYSKHTTEDDKFLLTNAKPTKQTLTERSIQLIQQLIAVDPPLAHQITKSLLTNESITLDSDDGSLRDLLCDSFLNVVKQHLTNGKVKEAVNLIRYFSVFEFYTNTGKDSREQTFNQILDNIAHATVQEHRNCVEDPTNTTTLPQLMYESLLASNNESMLNKYVQLEDKAWSSVPISHFFAQKFLENENYPYVDVLFRPILNYVRVTNKFLLESIVEECINAIASKGFAQLKIMMAPPKLRRLRPLILLLCWDRYKSDIDTRREMIKVLWPHDWVESNAYEQEGDAILVHACNELSFQLHSADNMAEMIIRAKEPINRRTLRATQIITAIATNDNLARVILDLLVEHSISFIIGAWLPQLEEEQIIAMLQRRPVVRGEENRRDTELDVVRGYYTIHNFLTGAYRQADVEKVSTRIANSLAKVVTPTHRLIILKLLYNVMFLRKTNIKEQAKAKDTFLAPKELIESTLHTITSNLENAEGADLQEFSEKVQDTNWRFEFAKYASTHSSLEKVHLIDVMIASPDTLLTIALRKCDFDRARRVILRYGKLKHSMEDVSVYEQAHNIREAFRVHSDTSSQLLTTFLSREDVPFSTVLDLLLTLHAKPEVLKTIISRAKELQGTRTGAFDRMEALMDHFTEEPLYVANSKLFKRSKTAKEARDMLKNITERENKYTLLRTIIEESKLENIQVWRDIEKAFGNDYLGTAIHHFNQTTEIIGENLMYTLSHGPREIAIGLIFGNRYNEALEICKLNTIEPLRLMIDALASENPPTLTIGIIENFLQKICDNKVAVVMICTLSLPRQKTRYDLIPHIAKLTTSLSAPVQQWWKQVELMFDHLAIVEGHPLSASGEKTAALLNLMEVDLNGPFYFALVQKLIEKGDFEAALRMADRGLNIQHRTPDFLFKLYVENMPDKTKSHLYVSKVKDRDMMATLAAEQMQYWEIEQCIDVLQMCVTHFDAFDQKSELHNRTRILLQHVKLLQKIIALDNTPTLQFENWTQLWELSKRDGRKIISELIQALEFDLARECVQVLLHDDDSSGVDDAKSVALHIEEQWLLHMLTNKYESRSEVIQRLVQLAPEDALKISRFVQSRLTSYEARLYLNEFIVTSLREYMNEEVYNMHARTMLGMRALCAIDESMQERLEHLIQNARLIVENLVMWGETAIVARVLKSVPELKNDDMMIVYGKKALNTDNQSTPSIKHTDITLTDNDEEDDLLRAQHQYPQAPSMLLAKAILDQCSQPVRAGEALLSMTDHISTVPSLSREARVNLVEKMVQYCKICFLSDIEAQEQIVMCDSILTRAELLKLIIYKDLGPNQHQNSQYLHELTIGDLSSQSKARQLRDSLLSEDQMELALDVATRCQIESEPVWTQWGLALLSLGKYKLAREKFKYCTSLSITQKINLLTQILNVLEGGPPVSQIVKRLKERPEPHSPWDDTLLDITMDISDLTKQQRTSPLHTHMDETRMTEAKHYIVSLGNDDVYVLFLVRNGQIEEAVNHVVTKALPAALFVETIASYCLRRGLISYLIRLLGKYPNLNSSYPLAMCKYLNAKGAFHMLYKVQVYLQDHVRAGLTCVRLFINSIGDMQEKLRLLEEAKKHFVQGLSQMQKALQENMRSTGASFVASSSFKIPRSGSVSGGKGTSAGAVLKPEEISKYIKTIDLQSEVTKAQVMNENLFGSPKVKCDIVEAHLGTHFDLAYRIANEYHLPHVKLYARTLCELSKKKQVNVVNDLLKNIRSTPIADDDWDTIVNAIIKVYVTDLGDKAGAEKFIARLKDDSRKVKACLLCERYKAAYLIAVKDDRIQDVKLIYNVTSKLENNKNAQTVADISFKFLQSRGVKV